ncbi:MAG: class I SAM-dependent methyltransferase [Hyphomicrobiaceae bacterium]
MGEIDEIKQRYARRDNQAMASKNVSSDRFSVLASNERRIIIRDTLQRHFRDRDFGELTALDVGCGSGGTLVQLMELGFNPENLVGIELTSTRAEAARKHLPTKLAIIEGDATTADVPYSSFDVIQQSTVFTSILDDNIQQRLAQRMWDLLKPGGVILWYDFVYNNPNNKDVRGVPLARIHSLFPTGSITTHRVTLAPPIGRRAARISSTLYALLNALPFLRSHVFVAITKS